VLALQPAGRGFGYMASPAAAERFISRAIPEHIFCARLASLQQLLWELQGLVGHFSAAYFN
jgi:hypothetical protein